MATDNPYRTFVDGFVRLLSENRALSATELARLDRPLMAAAAPKALIFAPHPDDEAIIGGLPLRLLRELKMKVANVAVTLGSRVDRQAERWQELKNCCEYIGFGLVSTGERGLEGLNPAAREKGPSRVGIVSRGDRPDFGGAPACGHLLPTRRRLEPDPSWGSSSAGRGVELFRFGVPDGRDGVLGCDGHAQPDGRVKCGRCGRSGGCAFAARGRSGAKCLAPASAGLDDRLARTAPDLPRKVGENLFLAAYGDDAQALAMAKYARDVLKLQRVALWIDESRVYTRTVGSFFDKFFRQLGGTVEKRTYAEEVTDFRDFIAAYKAANPKPEAIYSASMPRTAVPLIEQVRAAGIDVPLLSGDGWDDEEIVVASKRMEIKDIYFTAHRFLGVDTPDMRAFVKAYTRKFGAPPPNAFAPLGFDTVNLLADAIERAGSIKPEAIRATLAKTIDFQGVVGRIAYAPGSRVPIKAVSVIRIDIGVETLAWTWTPQ